MTKNKDHEIKVDRQKKRKPYFFLMIFWVSQILSSDSSSLAEVVLYCGSGEMFWKQLYRSLVPSAAEQQWKSTCSPFSLEQNLFSPSRHWNAKGGRTCEDTEQWLHLAQYVYVGLWLYLLISTVQHIPLLFAALFKSLFYAIDGLCLTSQPLVAYTWQALYGVEGTHLRVVTQRFNDISGGSSRRKADVRLLRS